MKLDVKRKFYARSERVKAVDIHPTEPWLLVALYTGHVLIWNYVTAQVHKTFEVCPQPIRAAKFIARKQWFVVGSDDLYVRVFNYNTMEKVAEWQAHQDYVRSVAVHPTLPIVLTGSDDTTICQWNWDMGWKQQAKYEGHTHFVMQVVFNPKDPSTFATASLDKTIKVWGLGAQRSGAYFTLEGHEKGVNCVEYYPGADKPYMVSGGDDHQVRIWDYQTKACVQTIDAHTHNITFVAFHPDLPLILSGSEDGSVKLWHSSTFRHEKTLEYSLERAWCCSILRGTRKVAFGYDEGSVMVRLGKDTPVASVDAATGKCIISSQSQLEISQVQVKGLAGAGTTDGERLSLSSKELGTCETPPRQIIHDPSGRFAAALIGDAEWVVYTAIAWRSKCFGAGTSFAWGPDAAGLFAVARPGSSSISIYRNFEEDNTASFRVPMPSVDELFGGAGPLLGVRCGDSVLFYDWRRPGHLIRRIDVGPRRIIWNPAGTLVALVCESSTYVLKYARDMVDSMLMDPNTTLPEAGMDEAFDVVDDIADKFRDGQFVHAGILLLLSKQGRLVLWTNGHVLPVCVCDRAASFFLAYLGREERALLMDKTRSLVTYRVPQNLIEALAAISSTSAADDESADIESGEVAQLLRNVPAEYTSTVAKHLQSLGRNRLALLIAPDDSLKFDLAIELGSLDLAMTLARESAKTKSASTAEHRFRTIADLALAQGRGDLAKECLERGRDLPGLLLLSSCMSDRTAIEKVASDALTTKKFNLAFTAYMILQRVDKCLDVLLASERFADATAFARSFCVSRLPECLEAWKRTLGAQSSARATIAAALADPVEYPNLFDDWEHTLQADKLAARRGLSVPSAVPGMNGAEVKSLVDLLKANPSLADREDAASSVQWSTMTQDDDDELEANRQDVEENMSSLEDDAKAQTAASSEVGAHDAASEGDFPEHEDDSLSGTTELDTVTSGRASAHSHSRTNSNSSATGSQGTAPAPAVSTPTASANPRAFFAQFASSTPAPASPSPTAAQSVASPSAQAAPPPALSEEVFEEEDEDWGEDQ